MADPFPYSNYVGITHGTLESHDLKATRRFHREFLGVDTLRHTEPAFLTYKDGHFWIACVDAGENVVPQTIDNRWELDVATPGDVDAAHAAAVREQSNYRIRTITAITEVDGIRSFALQDLDGNWWEIGYRDRGWFDAAFARGDVA